jgi:hypothetical protein
MWAILSLSVVPEFVFKQSYHFSKEMLTKTLKQHIAIPIPQQDSSLNIIFYPQDEI